MTSASRTFLTATLCTFFFSCAHARLLDNPIIRVTASCNAPKTDAISDEIDALDFEKVQQKQKPSYTKQDVETLKAVLDETAQDPAVMNEALNFFHEMIVHLNDAIQSITIEGSPEIDTYVNVIKFQSNSWKNTADHVFNQRKITKPDALRIGYISQRLMIAASELFKVGLYHAQNSTLGAWPIPSRALVNLLKSSNNIFNFFARHTKNIRSNDQCPKALVTILETTEKHCENITLINQSLIARIENNPSEEQIINAFETASDEYNRQLGGELLLVVLGHGSDALSYLTLLCQSLIEQLTVNE